MKANADAQRLTALIKDRNAQAAETINQLKELDRRIDAKEVIVAEWDRLHNK
jgi:hypothetical protein